MVHVHLGIVLGSLLAHHAAAERLGFAVWFPCGEAFARLESGKACYRIVLDGDF